jgi:hypothetical protein
MKYFAFYPETVSKAKVTAKIYKVNASGLSFVGRKSWTPGISKGGVSEVYTYLYSQGIVSKAEFTKNKGFYVSKTVKIQEI